MHWQRIETDQPILAARARHMLIEPGILLIATLRRDGLPRVSTAEPVVWRGDLWVSTASDAPSARDLMRDRRLLLHSIVTSREGAEGELKLRGSARAKSAEPVLAEYADEAAHSLGRRPEPTLIQLFRIDVEELTLVRNDRQSGDQFVVRWPDAEEFVRRAGSPDKEPLSEILVAPPENPGEEPAAEPAARD